MNLQILLVTGFFILFGFGCGVKTDPVPPQEAPEFIKRIKDPIHSDAEKTPPPPKKDDTH